MRVLVYGLQSSGASLFTFWLSQLNGYVGVIDLFAGKHPPSMQEVGSENLILKATVSDLSFDTCVQEFNPDKKILFIRNPYQNYISLKKKSFKNKGGKIDAKFKTLNTLFRKKNMFDAVITYEDFIQNKEEIVRSLNAIEIPVSKDNYFFRRSPEDIIQYNCEQSEYLAKTHKNKWDIGNIHTIEGVVSLELKGGGARYLTRRKVKRFLPHVVEYYYDK